MMKRIAILACLSLAACGVTDSDPGPGGVTAGEAEMLDEAAEALDEQMAPPPLGGQTTQQPAQAAPSE